MSEIKEELKKKILEEMMIDYADELAKNFNLAKQFIRITKEGKVKVLVKDEVSDKERILLYLIGKMYAKEAGLAEAEEVENKELMEELGIPEGSLFARLKELRDENKIKQVRRGKNVLHTVPIKQIEEILEAIDKKVRTVS